MISKLKFMMTALVATLLMQGCVAAIPLVVAVMDDGATVVADVPVSAEKLYEEALKSIDENPNVKIVSQDDEKRHATVERDDDQASLQAIPLAAGRTQMIIMTDIAGEDEEGNRKFALNIAKNICEKLGVRYEVVENP